MFGKKDFRLLLQRYKRWSVLEALEEKPEGVKRTWFVSFMTESVLPMVEKVFEKTENFEELVCQTAFPPPPSLVNDLSIRNEVAGPPLAAEGLQWTY